MRNFPQHLKTFFEIYKREDYIEIYNEFSVYFRLGYHLENLFNVDYKIQFMREPDIFGIDDELVKPHLDIVIIDDDMHVLHAIEVVYIKDEPRLEKLFEVCTGLRFMEQLIERGFQDSYVLLIADIPPQDDEQPHYIFRGEITLEGDIQQPTDGDAVIELEGSYTINWQKVEDYFYYAVVPIRP